MQKKKKKKKTPKGFRKYKSWLILKSIHCFKSISGTHPEKSLCRDLEMNLSGAQ
jgi:hypothetical protein